MFCYAPMYRPPMFSTIPKGWELVETPKDRSGINRPDVPTSREHRFGVIGYAQRLSKDDQERFELQYVGER